MFLTLLFLFLTFLILTHSQVSLDYALSGFALWYGKMIPTLLPFMILSGALIRLNLSEKFASLLHPVIGRIYQCRKNVSYAIIIGFLCGFPMGAKVTADLLENQKITYQEASFLISFNNNIGPVYFCGFVVPLLGIKNLWICLFAMYGIPLLYAFLLRRTVFREAFGQQEQKGVAYADNETALVRVPLFDGVDAAIKNAVQSILSLCGYMVLFNTLNIMPHFIFPSLRVYLSPLLEITGGLSQVANKLPIYSLCVLQFGGLSCIAQTNGMISGTGLSLGKYVVHKGILTAITGIFYFATLLLGLSLFE